MFITNTLLLNCLFVVLKHSKYGQTGIDVSAMLSGRGFGYRKVGVWEGLKNGVSATWSRNICYIATGCIMFPNQSSGIYDTYINGTVNFAVGIVHEPLQRFCPSWGLAIVRRMVFALAFMYSMGFAVFAPPILISVSHRGFGVV